MSPCVGFKAVQIRILDFNIYLRQLTFILELNSAYFSCDCLYLNHDPTPRKGLHIAVFIAFRGKSDGAKFHPAQQLPEPEF